MKREKIPQRKSGAESARTPAVPEGLNYYC